MRKFRAVVLALICGLILAACGARLNPQTRDQAANALLNANGGTGTSSGTTNGTTGLPSTNGGGSTTNGGGTITNGGGSTTRGGGGSTTSGGGSTTNGGGSTSTSGGGSTSGSKCPTSGTDVGLTSNSVTLGVVASTTGPVSGLFQGALQGMQAYRAYANSQGGICGHQVNIQFADDATNCGQNQNDTQNLASKVFAFVGSF